MPSPKRIKFPKFDEFQLIHFVKLYKSKNYLLYLSIKSTRIPMKNKNYLLLFSVLFLFLLTPIIPLQAQAPGRAGADKDNKPKKLNYIPNSTTSGNVVIDGKNIAYKAVAGTVGLVDNRDEQDTTARMSYVAYFKNDAKPTTRPITFFYNGGPGSSTLWLHLGSLGPKRVVTEGTDYMGGAPYQLVSNEYSLLDVSDLVFIDMPATGFGRILEGKESDYHSVDNDAAAFAQFIRNFVTEYGRWNSPKYLFGESYGTLRSALVASVLQSQHNMNLNGVILLSQILDYNNSVDRIKRHPGNHKAFELALSTYAATAWYHNKLNPKPADLETFLREVEEFALTDYAMALDKGHLLDEATFNRIANKLHEYTGLSVDFIKKANLRVDGGEFRQQLLGEDGMTTGRLDTRYSGPVMDPLAQRAFSDPQSDAISSAYVSLLNEYMRKDLKYGKNMEYRVSAYSRMRWKSEHRGSPGTVNVINSLASAMKKNPDMKVLLTAGYYDLATPYYEGVYELAQLPIPKELYEKNVKMAFYEAGHMMYLHLPSLKKLKEDVKSFMTE